MLRACQRAAIPPPKELVDLFQILFELDRPPQKGVPVGPVSRASEFLKENPTASLRDVADYVNQDKPETAQKVAASTISRWKRNGLLR
jgi:hypothetical protein